MEKIIQILQEENPDPGTVARICEEMVNSFTFNPAHAAQELLNTDAVIKGRFTQLAAAFIKMLAYFHSNGLADGRNEIACKIAYAIYTCESAKTIVGSTNWIPDFYGKNVQYCERRYACELDFGAKCVMKMQSMHRTLQQQFAALCFCFIRDSMTRETKDAIAEDSGIQYWNQRLPMI